MARRPNPKDYVDNFLNYDAPIPDKLGMVARNTYRRVIRRKMCCGNHGQPGC